MKRKLLSLIILALLDNTSFAAETVIEVIPLFNRPATEIQELLNPLLENNDHVIADGANLLVKTSPERLGEIIMLIDKLDTPLNNLIITVIQSRHSTAEELNAAAKVTLDHQRNGRLKSSGQISSKIYQTEEQSSTESTQTIRTMEGKAAHITVGKTYPTQNIQINNYGYGYGYGYPAISTSTGFIEATTGFEVTPKLVEANPRSAKQQVILDVSPWSEKLNTSGQLETRNAQSTLKINLGEWVELGGSNEDSHSSSNGNLVTVHQTNQNNLHILVKVDKAN